MEIQKWIAQYTDSTVTGLCSKLYSYLTDGNIPHKQCKGIKKYVSEEMKR